MRVPPSRPENLNTGGVNIKIYSDTRLKLRQLCALRGEQLAKCLDQVVDEALQAEWDRLEGLTQSGDDRTEDN